MARRDNDYFNVFIKQIEYPCQAIRLLIDTMIDYQPMNLRKRIAEMRKIVNDSDSDKREMIERLAREFITSIEREDIVLIVHQINKTTEAIEAVLMQMYMLNIKAIRKDALEMAYSIEQCCLALKRALVEFPNFRKSRILKQYLVTVNQLAEKGDQKLLEAMHRLYLSDMTPIAITSWTHVYLSIEKAWNTYKDVSNVIECMIIKNS
jgi:uncharacterized protein